MISIKDIANENYKRYKGKKGPIITLDKTKYLLEMYQDLYQRVLCVETGLSDYNVTKILQSYGLKSRELTKEERTILVHFGKSRSFDEQLNKDVELKESILEFLKTEPIGEVARCFDLDLNCLVSWCVVNDIEYIINKNLAHNSSKSSKILTSKPIKSNNLIPKNSALFNEDEKDFIEELRKQLIPEEIARRFNFNFDRNITSEQIKNYFKVRKKLFVTDTLRKERRDIIDDLMAKGVTDIDKIYDACLVTRGVLSDYMKHRLHFIEQSKQHEKELASIRIREGLQAAKSRGVKFGRPEVEFPPNFKDEYIKWKNLEQTAAQTMKNLNLKRTKFYDFVNKFEDSSEYEEALSQIKGDEEEIIDEVIPEDIISEPLEDRLKKLKEINTKIKEFKQEAIELKQKAQEQEDLQATTLLKFDKAIDEVIKYSYNHKYLNKDVIYYILEVNGFEEMMKRMEKVRQNYDRNN